MRLKCRCEPPDDVEGERLLMVFSMETKGWTLFFVRGGGAPRMETASGVRNWAKAGGDVALPVRQPRPQSS